MKRLVSKMLGILITAALLLLPIPGGAFDKVPGDLFGFAPEVYKNLSDCIVSIETHGTGLGWNWVNDHYEAVQGFFFQKGSGVVVRGKNGNIYILTNHHVVSPEMLVVSISPLFSMITPVLRILTQSVYVGSWEDAHQVECKVVWTNQELDITILKPIWKSSLLRPIPYDMISPGMMWELEKDDAVTIVTGYRDKSEQEIPAWGIFPERQWWYEARTGKILKVGPMTFVNEWLAWFNMTDITTDVKIYPGDSGSPAFIYDNGKPYLIGLFRAISIKFDDFGQVESYLTYFTPIADIVLRYLSTEGID